MAAQGLTKDTHVQEQTRFTGPEVFFTNKAVKSSEVDSSVPKGFRVAHREEIALAWKERPAFRQALADLPNWVWSADFINGARVALVGGYVYRFGRLNANAYAGPDVTARVAYVALEEGALKAPEGIVARGLTGTQAAGIKARLTEMQKNLDETRTEVDTRFDQIQKGVNSIRRAVEEK
jgi:hypothetical protein